MKLKPCPFCGCKPKVYYQKAPIGNFRTPFNGIGALIQCESRRCNINPSTGYSETEGSLGVTADKESALLLVANPWNKRASNQ